VVRDAEVGVVGFGAVTGGAGEAHLLDLAVADGWRRRGLATLLVRHLRVLARDELAAAAMTLEVRVGNHPARALYRHLGFVEAGVRPGYYPHGGPDGGREDAAIMWDDDLHAPVPDPEES
jgi:ribosomal-protein-alanine N-acetyltransferase